MNRFDYMCRVLQLLLKGMILHMEATFDVTRRPGIKDWIEEAKALARWN